MDQTYLLKTDRTETLIGMLAIVSPLSFMLGSMTWQRRMGWSRTVTSRLDLKITWTCWGRSTGPSVPWFGTTVNRSQTSLGQESLGSKEKLQKKKQDTVYPLKYEHAFVVLCFVMVVLWVWLEEWDLFILTCIQSRICLCSWESTVAFVHLKLWWHRSQCRRRQHLQNIQSNQGIEYTRTDKHYFINLDMQFFWRKINDSCMFFIFP